METRKDYQEVIDSLDELYKKQIRQHTGLTPAPQACNNTARLYRLIPRYLELQKKVVELEEKNKSLNSTVYDLMYK